MGSLDVAHFSDPDEYATSIRASRVQLTVTERGHFAADRLRIDFKDLWMQRFHSNLAWVAHTSIDPARTVFFFRTKPGSPFFRGKTELGENQLAFMSLAEATFQRTTGTASYAAMSLPAAVAATSLSEFAGLDLASPKSTQHIQPEQAAFSRLLNLHAAAGNLAVIAPEIIKNSNAALALEQELIHALVNCLVTSRYTADASAERRHALIMRRFHAHIAARSDHAIFIPELCLAIGVSERTLRACCLEHLGMGPNRYLWLRRMQMARRALLHATPKVTSVTGVATDLGFWELGRFAVSYRQLYGESPSRTLARIG
ncbi:MAG TPA: helix-turn-helix domain-containing protein [Acidisoma sp.]|jgi:AraC-like DNA-binding protein|uniref:helix-turn-helix domain-containing protein n=1 Tax=Acidisoma sp. TaxID=1872115 RepID=UPI002C3EF48E|nr:helix-turn-helix domain-containing protein [Acidisoma sp.]HTI03332.1 helix-turn-helix domain-containing protein [Acidisoma sp.]